MKQAQPPQDSKDFAQHQRPGFKNEYVKHTYSLLARNISTHIGSSMIILRSLLRYAYSCKQSLGDFSNQFGKISRPSHYFLILIKL